MTRGPTPPVLHSDEEVQAGLVRRSFERKMVAAHSAAIECGSYIMPIGVGAPAHACCTSTRLRPGT